MRRLKTKDKWLVVLVVVLFGYVLLENIDSSDAKVLLKGTAQIVTPEDKPKGISGDTYVIEKMSYVGYSFLRVKFKGASSDEHLSDRTIYLYKCTDHAKKEKQKCVRESRMGFVKGDRITSINEGKASSYFLDEGYYMVKVKKKVRKSLLRKSFYEKTEIFKFTK